MISSWKCPHCPETDVSQMSSNGGKWCRTCDHARRNADPIPNQRRMWVAGEYISKKDPRHVPGRYASWLDAANGTHTPVVPEKIHPEYDASTAGGIRVVYSLQERRVFQQKWSKAVHRRDNRCVVSGALNFTDAAHIKPVKVCKEVDRKGMNDLDNGLVLRTDLHRAFEQGYFTYDINGWLKTAGGYIIVSQVPNVRWRKLFTAEQHVYLKWHRENVFDEQIMEKKHENTDSGHRRERTAS